MEETSSPCQKKRILDKDWTKVKQKWQVLKINGQNRSSHHY